MTKTPTYLIDADDDLDMEDLSNAPLTREMRIEIVEIGYRSLRELGYPAEARFRPLCDAFIEGKMNFEELYREINRPHMN